MSQSVEHPLKMKEGPQWLLGPALTIASVGLMAALERVGWGIPSAAPVLLVVTFAAYVWGLKSGLACAGILAVYTIHFLGGPVFPSDELLRRAIIVSFLGFGVAGMLGTLRAREARALAHAWRAERERTETAEAASRTLMEKNRALEAFSYTVAHDLRSPLRGVETLTTFTLKDHGDRMPKEARNELGTVVESARRMSRLLDDILHFSRAQRADLQPEDVEMCALAREAAADVRERHPGRRVTFTCEGGEAHATGDVRLLRLVLVNLIDNAWKFTRERDPHARVTFGARRMDDAAGSGVVFHVRDNGAGFEPDQASEIFREFQRLHDEREFHGTGIGLATVRRIIERHGGHVWAEGRPGDGATVYFTLGDPVRLVPAEGADADAETVREGNGSSAPAPPDTPDAPGTRVETPRASTSPTLGHRRQTAGHRVHAPLALREAT